MESCGWKVNRAPEAPFILPYLLLPQRQPDQEDMIKNKQPGMEKCVIVYEDDQEISTLCKRILEKPGRRIEIKRLCDDVIADIEQLKPDIILMDLWIPEMGGEKAVAVMKSNPATRNIPVILFSANSELAKISRKVNADGYLEKPFNISDLRAIIEEHIL
jgi:CheY-like chemotaxis protein